MSIRLEVYDGLNPILDAMANVSRGVALESLSVAGNYIRNNARNELLTAERHNWFQRIAQDKKSGVLGGRQIVYDASRDREFGSRMSYETGGNARPGSMANFITSFLMDNHMLMVVGGKHGRSKQTKYREGKAVGSFSLGSVTKQSHAILHKLNFGEQNEHHRWKEGSRSIKQFEGKWQARRFMEKGYRGAVPAINNAMNSRLLSLLGGAINNIEIRERKVV